MAKRRPWPPPRMPRLLAVCSETLQPGDPSSFFCSSAWICCCVRLRSDQGASDAMTLALLTPPLPIELKTFVTSPVCL